MVLSKITEVIMGIIVITLIIKNILCQTGF